MGLWLIVDLIVWMVLGFLIFFVIDWYVDVVFVGIFRRVF